MTALFITFLVTLAVFTAFWAWSIKVKDAGIVDFYWGPGFVLIAWIAWAYKPVTSPPALILLSALTLWGLRLGWYMTRRHTGQEDARYADMRQRHGEEFGRKSLWMVFWLQAVIQWIASSPALVVFASDRGMAALPGSTGFQMLLALGLVLFTLGFLLEVWADHEVQRFKADPRNRGKLLTTGLHSRIRHPNYAGEIILQCGFGVMAYALSLNLLSFIGPLLMTGLIVKLSGVPMLENELSKREGFADWKARTGALLPRI
jgi:steroid 5-alpha reductase family enzyme